MIDNEEIMMSESEVQNVFGDPTKTTHTRADDLIKAHSDSLATSVVSTLSAEPEHEILTYKDEEEKRLCQKLECLLVNADTPCEKPEYLLKDVNGRMSFPTENLQMIVAPMKSGKTTFGAILMASVLGGGESFGLFATKQDTTILHLDTEQAVYDQVNVLRYVRKLCGNNVNLYERLKSVHLRSVKLEDRLKIAEYAIRAYKPTFVYIDGIKEFCKDINDNSECTEIIQTLEAFADKYRCAIANVIHTNKNKEDLLPRGALGTELQNKVSDGIQLKKDEIFVGGEKTYLFTADHYLSRHLEMIDVVFERDFRHGGEPIPASRPEVNPVVTQEEQTMIMIENAIVKALASAEDKDYSMTAGVLKAHVSKEVNLCESAVANYLKGVRERMQGKLEYFKQGKYYVYRMISFDGYDVSITPKILTP